MKRNYDDYVQNECIPIGATDFDKSYIFDQSAVDDLLDALDWYKMWHQKHIKKIKDLEAELTDYRPTKLSGNGQCKCELCGFCCWTDWFYEYKRKVVCDNCLKKMQGDE